MKTDFTIMFVAIKATKLDPLDIFISLSLSRRIAEQIKKLHEMADKHEWLNKIRNG